MSAVPKLLVVDDEPVVCLSCSRIFEGRGYRVETATSPEEGLAMAASREYAAILLDLLMPRMDGLEFLRELREQNLDVPVVVITGYASVSNAVEAMRLGAIDYVPKPFAPDEIARVVGRIAPAKRSPEAPAGPAQDAAAESAIYRYVDEAWFRADDDGTVLTGAVVESHEARRVEELVLPRVGDALHRGLPLAALRMPGGEQRVVPSPLSGTVVEVNEALRGKPATLADDPCDRSWLARVRPGRLDEDVMAGRVREVLVVAPSDARARSLAVQLRRIGCTVRVAGAAEGTLEAAWSGDATLVLLDARSLGASGPGLARTLGDRLPELRLVALDVPAPALEREYLSAGVLYHTVEPVRADELLDIVVSAHRSLEAPSEPAPRGRMLPAEVRAVRIVNRNGRKVSLLAAPGVLRENAGVGAGLLEELARQGFPVHVALGRGELTAERVRLEAAEHDRVVLLEAVVAGRLPGSLERRDGSDVPELTPADLEKLVTLQVEPSSPAGDLDMEPRISTALAELLAGELAQA